MTRLQVADSFTGSTEGLGDRIMGFYERYLDCAASASEVAYWVSQYAEGHTDEYIITQFIMQPSSSPTRRNDE